MVDEAFEQGIKAFVEGTDGKLEELRQSVHA